MREHRRRIRADTQAASAEVRDPHSMVPVIWHMAVRPLSQLLTHCEVVCCICLVFTKSSCIFQSLKLLGYRLMRIVLQARRAMDGRAAAAAGELRSGSSPPLARGAALPAIGQSS